MDLDLGNATSTIDIISTIFQFLILIIVLTGFILSSVGLYVMAKRRVADKAFWAWIPIGKAYLEGKLARDTSVAQGTKSYLNMQTIFPICQAVYFAVICTTSIFPVFISSELVNSVINLITSFLGIGISIVGLVCLYGLLKGYDLKNAAGTHITLSIFIPLYSSIIIFAFRNRPFLFHEPDGINSIEVPL